MKYYLIIILGLIATSCQLELSNNKVIRDINNHSELYSDIVSRINKSDSIKHNGTLIKFNELPLDIADAFRNTSLMNRINYISIDKLPCGDISIVVYLGNEHLVYTSCPDSTFPVPNSYNKVGFIETWGINENWYLWKDNDTI